MNKWGKFIPYFIVLAFCLINVGIVGPNRQNKIILPFFNWCLFCSSDARYVKYYEVQIQQKNGSKLILTNRNNKHPIDALNVNDIVSMHTKSQLTIKRLREISGHENATVFLYEISCDVHQWFLQDHCDPEKLMGVYEI